MRADLRHKINFLSPPTGTDDYGSPNTEWTTYKSGVWASADPLLGNEYFSAEAVQSKVEVKFRCIWFSGVTNKMRIEYNFETYEILSAINVKSMNRKLLCYCKKVT